MSRPARPTPCDLAIFLAIWALLAYCCRSCWAEPSTQPTTQPAECFDLKSDDAGQFVFTPILPGRVPCGGGRYWTCDEDGAAFDDYAPHEVCWRGRVAMRSDCEGLIELKGWANSYRDFEVIEFAFVQSPAESTATYVIRTPVGQPDVTVRRSERLTATLLLRNPELRPMLDQVLAGIGCEPYDVGPFVRSQLAGTLAVTPEVAARTRVLILLAGDCRSWRNRERAQAALSGMGRDGAAALLLMDRRGLTAGQALARERCLAGWPVMPRHHEQRRPVDDRLPSIP